MDGTVKLGDFGLATSIQTNVVTTSKKHTPGIGTKTYMSPELLEQRNDYSNKVDIYSLGLIYFELLRPMATDSERVRNFFSTQEVSIVTF